MLGAFALPGPWHEACKGIYWATSCGFLDPMSEDRCPMATEFRQPNLYGTPNAAIENALTGELRAHRDFIYEEHLQLRIVF